MKLFQDIIFSNHSYTAKFLTQKQPNEERTINRSSYSFSGKINRRSKYHKKVSNTLFRSLLSKTQKPSRTEIIKYHHNSITKTKLKSDAFPL